MDLYHHVNNVTYANYLESARVEFLAQHSLDPTVEGYGQFVARLEIDYLAPLTYRSKPVDMELWVSDIGTSSYVINYELNDGDQVYVRAKTVMVCVNIEHNIPGRIPQVLRNILDNSTRDH